MARQFGMGTQHLSGAGGGWEPQRQSNFEVIFPGLPNEGWDGVGNNDLALSVDTASLPNLTFGEIELNHLNERVWVAGGVTFEATTIVCKDYLDPDAMDIVDQWVGQLYNARSGRMGLAKNYKKEGRIYLYAPDGGRRRVWDLQGCWPQTVNYGGTLDQSAKDAINTIELTIRYDRAFYNRDLKESDEVDNLADYQNVSSPAGS